MQKRGILVGYFLFFLILCVLLFFLGKTAFFKPVSTLLQEIFSPFAAISYNLVSKVSNFTVSSKLKTLQDDNLALSKKLADQNRLVLDNKALMDQFSTTYPRSPLLIPADVVGAPSFVPGFSVPESLILARGEKDGVGVGDAVVYKDSLIGKIVKTSAFTSSVLLITNSSSSFTAKTLTGSAQGVIKGQGGGKMILDNVLLSESIKKDDLVLTKGSVNEESVGFLPDLIVGKITSISKNVSDLFQKAEVKSSLDFTKLNKVFIILND